MAKSLNWFSGRVNRPEGQRRARGPRRPPPAFQPLLEGLELRLAPSTFTVINTNDSGAGSLRQAILDANTNLGLDTICFNIPGSGVHTISLTSALPPIADPVFIDGYTQPANGGAAASQNTLAVGDNAVLLIELNGTSANGDGLTVGAGGG